MKLYSQHQELLHQNQWDINFFHRPLVHSTLSHSFTEDSGSENYSCWNDKCHDVSEDLKSNILSVANECDEFTSWKAFMHLPLLSGYAYYAHTHTRTHCRTPLISVTGINYSIFRGPYEWKDPALHFCWRWNSPIGIQLIVGSLD